MLTAAFYAAGCTILIPSPSRHAARQIVWLFSPPMSADGAIPGPHEGPLLYAHRGASHLAPENTLPAFREALAVGADVLEIDCHMTADGQVVVAHDATGARVASVDRAIRETTLDQLQAWDVSRDFQGTVAEPARVPTLDEVLRELPGARLNIDVKQSEPDMVGPLLRLIDAHGAADRVLLTSFAHGTLARVRAAGYRGATGSSRREALAAAFLPRALRGLLGPRGARVQLPSAYAGLDLGSHHFVSRFHDQGLAVDFWVINEPVEARRLLDHGADGIVTDVPEVIAEVFREHHRTGPWRARHGR